MDCLSSILRRVEPAHLRIGELARRVGVSTELLRAWERRYGLLEPARSDGGYRLYSDADVARVEAMQAHLAEGLSAAEAAQLARSGVRPASAERAVDHAAELWSSLDAFDDARAQAAFDRLVGDFTVETVVGETVLPYLRLLGERWRKGDASVAQEHFATTLLRERLLALARGWDSGIGPRVLLACPPGERHDLGLVAFGLALRARGWRVTFLGPDTPMDTLAATAERLEPDAIVLAALTREPLTAAARRIVALAREQRVLIGGAGADGHMAKRTGTTLLEGGPLEAAAGLASSG